MRRSLKDLPAQTEQRQSTTICRGSGQGSRAQAKAERYAEVALSAAVKLRLCMCVCERMFVCACLGIYAAILKRTRKNQK